MIDHIGLGARDYPASKRFFEAALKPLGYRLVMDLGEYGAGFGTDPKPDFWVGPSKQTGEANSSLHIAFHSPDRATVDAFYAAAIAAGGRDNGPPGPRPVYHPNYYGAFVLDLDGNNIEAVCHSAP